MRNGVKELYRERSIMKTLVLGLDAATWSVIDPLFEKDELPNLKRLMNTGIDGTLNSTKPPLTPLAWTSMVTGLNPGNHGIFDFLEQDTKSYAVSPIDYKNMEQPTIWDVLNAHDIDVGVVNFPVAHPPHEVDSFFVSGIPVNEESQIAYPTEVQTYLDSIDYQIQPTTDPKSRQSAYFDELVDITQKQFNATIHLDKRYDPDLLWTVFMGIDWAQHYLWESTVDGKNAVDAFYRAVDSVIGELLESIEPENVLIVSDHGARPIRGEIHVNSLLKELGYLTKESPSDTGEAFRNSVLGRIWKTGRSLPTPIKQKIRAAIPNGLIKDMRAAADFGHTGQMQMHTSIDWEQSRAFSFGSMGRIFIHRSDHYSSGTVPPEEYESVRKELLRDLQGLTHPETGEKLIESVETKETIYTGKYTEAAPDLVFTPTDEAFSVRGDFADRWVHEPTGYVGDHDQRGVCILAGSDINTGTADLEITDIGPTLLHLLKCPVLERMDGTVRTDLFASGREPLVKSLSDVLPTELSISSESETRTVQENLEDLGYL